MNQTIVNVGTVGHIDHGGKTQPTLIKYGKCVTCGKQVVQADMITIMSGIMHRYVCSTQCMHDFYK